MTGSSSRSISRLPPVRWLVKIAVTGLVTSSAAADGSNTGNGVITLDATAPVAPSAKNGVYRVVNELVATNSGEFVVYDPDGIEIGRVAVAATFSNQVKFVVADGSTDFAIGDAFSITVGIEETDYQIAAYNPAGTDGSQRVAAFFGKASRQTAPISAPASSLRAAPKSAASTWSSRPPLRQSRKPTRSASWESSASSLADLAPHFSSKSQTSAQQFDSEEVFAHPTAPNVVIPQPLDLHQPDASLAP